MHTVGILLGANIGNCLKTLESARTLIQQEIGLIDKTSSIYYSEPWKMDTSAQWFYNQALLVRTIQTPDEVLHTALAIETRLGRQRPQNNDNSYASRAIDIDLLLIDTLTLQTPDLQIPHPRLHLRRFALVPLCEIFSDWQHPIYQRSATELLDACEDPNKVTLLK
ncbi:hypothetical protein FACS1894201_08660 [Bacteroidia bacterium]|nr:hypothetical protein FACS1894201_08660 [Bacteroidia bacterium]